MSGHFERNTTLRFFLVSCRKTPIDCRLSLLEGTYFLFGRECLETDVSAWNGGEGGMESLLRLTHSSTPVFLHEQVTSLHLLSAD